MAIKHAIHKVTSRLKKDNENGARKAILEELFYDFNKSRVQVYKMNFMRGIFMGVGTVVGGTLVIALLAWLLSFFVNVPGVGEQIQQVQETIQGDKK